MNIFIDEDISLNGEYGLLTEEMNKYKTLAHSSIRWDDVFNYSRNIIESDYFDSRVIYYLVLSCVHLNHEDKFGVLDEILGKLILNWQTIKDNFDKTLPKKNEIYKKFFRNFLNELIENINNGKLQISNEQLVSLSGLCKELAMLSGDKSITEIKSIAPSGIKKVASAQNAQQTLFTNEPPGVKKEKIADSATMGEREYRNYYINIAENLINDDIFCLSPYLLYLQAAWGKINSLPLDGSVLYPDENLILELSGFSCGDKEAVLKFEKNLVLNPFWFEGQLLFLELLEKYVSPLIASVVSSALIGLLDAKPELLKLHFSNEKPFCDDECFKSIKVFTMSYGQGRCSTVQNNQTETGKQPVLQEAMQSIDENLYSGTISQNKALLKIAETLFDEGFMSCSALIYKKTTKNIE